MKKKVSLILALIMASLLVFILAGCKGDGFIDSIKELPAEEQAEKIYEKAIADESICDMMLEFKADLVVSGEKISVVLDEDASTYSPGTNTYYTKNHTKRTVTTKAGIETDEYTEGYISGRMFLDLGEGKRYYSELGYGEYINWYQSRQADAAEIFTKVTSENCRSRSAAIGEDGCCRVEMSSFTPDYLFKLGTALGINEISSLSGCELKGAKLTIVTDNEIRPSEVSFSFDFGADEKYKDNSVSMSMTMIFFDYDKNTSVVIDAPETFKEISDLRAYYDAQDFLNSVFAKESAKVDFSDNTSIGGDMTYKTTEKGKIEYGGTGDAFKLSADLTVNSSIVKIAYKNGKLTTTVDGTKTVSDMPSVDAKMMVIGYSSMFLFDIDEMSGITIGAPDAEKKVRKTAQIRLTSPDTSKFEEIIRTSGYDVSVNSASSSLLFTYNEDGTSIERVDFTMDCAGPVTDTVYNVTYNYTCSVGFAD